MQKVMKASFLGILLLARHIEMVDDEERPSSKEPTVEVEAQDIEVEGPTPEKE